MAELGPVAWPPAPIRTERLVLREPEARDRPAVIELFVSPEVGTYIGGPQPRDEFEHALPEMPPRRPGLFVVDLDGTMIGIVTLDRRDAERPGHVRPDAGEAELGYMFLPEAWGYGYAAEACAAALGWFADTLPSEPVVLCTQTANDRSMRLAAKLGFTEVERFEEYGAEQWFGVWSSGTPTGVVPCCALVPDRATIGGVPRDHARSGGRPVSSQGDTGRVRRPPRTTRGSAMLQIRRRFGRGAIVAVASAAVVAGAAGIAVASAPVPHISTATTLRLEARGGTSTFVNVRHLHHPAVGDEVILAQPIFSAAHPSQLVGHGWVTVILVGAPASQDHATLVLKDGQIDAAGIQASNPFQLAVTGGTRRFQNARGQATVRLLPGPGNKALITVSLLPTPTPTPTPTSTPTPRPSTTATP